MKKSNFLVIGLIIVSVGIFSGCQSTRDSVKIKELALNQDKRMGTIQSLGGAPVSSQATHLLRLNDGKTLFLKSSVIDLSDIKYNAKEVEVAGNIIRTTDGNEVMVVVNIDLVDRDTNLEQDVPQWTPYSSNNLQIALKYRSDYKLLETPDTLTLTKTEKPTSTPDNLAYTIVDKKESVISIKIISRDSNYNLLESMGVTSDSSSDLLAKGYSKSKITQKALDAYKQAKIDGTEVNYFIKSGYSYQFKFDAGESVTLVADQNMFYDVLASITFGAGFPVDSAAATAISSTPVSDSGIAANITMTEPADTTFDGFQEFTSETMKFSIKYPKGYYFENTPTQSPSAVRSYAFSTKPPGENGGELILLEIVKGSLPSGSKIDLGNGKSGLIVKSGSSVTIVVDKGNAQFFQLSGPSDKQTEIQQMASSIGF